MGRVILLTGGTGFIGTAVAERLVARAGTELLVLVQARDDEEAERVLAREWWDAPGLAAAVGGAVRPLAGDVRLLRLGLSAATYREVVGRADAIVHAAADLRIDAAIGDLRSTNVEGVRHVLDLARDVERDHGLARLVHVSTAYVAGRRRGTIEEDAPSGRDGFSTPYERSKYEGELLVRAAIPELPIAIARPGMVVGDSRTGWVKTFNTVYPPLRSYLTGRLRILPMRGDQRVNVVPVDHVADAIARMVEEPSAVGATFHLTAPPEELPTARELIRETRRWARSELGVRLPRPVFAPLPPPTRWRRTSPRAEHRSPIQALLPYLREDRTFVRSNTDRLTGPYDLAWRDHLPRLLDYATRCGFLHRSGRTAHEQLLHRLNGSRAIRYHDVAGGRHRARRGEDLRRDVLAAAASLGRLGVAPGDRVAVVGPNGTRYLTIDLAIGLAGAVSVPLYPTSPPADVVELVRASGSRVLFVGTAELLERLPPLPDVRIVSFRRDDPSAGRSDVEPWSTFLGRGANAAADGASPVTPDDLATIRSTSGTTGAPKGVLFDHRAIRWMGEVMPALVPWAPRNDPMRTVAFLPMSHVVEGILATYGPAYLPAPADVWFVEDLVDLPRVLPLVRPVVFFGVPRVYEKLWGRFARSSAGARYLRSGGLVREVLRPIVRRGLLRAAGLDRCSLLLVGSAPAGERLLGAFRELGIEVHDAYGQTEAPLVTINRVGRNRIGTVGVPLPETQVRIAEDGEVLVRGPQLTRGYLGDVDGPFRDGWLGTGDLGRLTDDGALVIEGRKKDLLKTSYGKYVRATRIETMLREVPGVDEAMVVAEGRPF
ncbi:MAG TPA: AMP-binding protein, partial [Actinomycetota bacterium]|nr:AMP-binding protein [Actinomycetota bacterium]